MCPIAWAVVDKETKHNRSFFINYLKEDLQMGIGKGLIVMADMPKGFHAVVDELLPNAEVRRRARNIWSNRNKTWNGEERRRQLWRCSKESFKVKFKDELHKITDLKSIITILVEIRRKLRTRTVDMIKFTYTWISYTAPMARPILEENKYKSKTFKVIWNADVGFEIGQGQCGLKLTIQRYSLLNLNKFMVDLQEIEEIVKLKPRKKYGKISKQRVKQTCSECKQQGHNKIYCKVPKEVAILNQEAPTNLDQLDSTNLHQQHQAIMLVQQQFVVIQVELRGQGN
ncbi:hypothetical protein KY285_035541 [Solanum tuberosum]|nr:hypothetical protein KY285_035541 [Solanum tuberosum]